MSDPRPQPQYAIPAPAFTGDLLNAAVLAWPGTRDESPLLTRVRSVTWEVGGQTVAKVEGYAGGIALTHIDVLPEEWSIPTPHTSRPDRSSN